MSWFGSAYIADRSYLLTIDPARMRYPKFDALATGRYDVLFGKAR